MVEPAHSLAKATKLKAVRAGILGLVLGLAISGHGAAAAVTSDRDSLFHKTLKRPKDLALAFAYVNACVETQDFEGAIGALERAAFFAPDDGQIKAQLGFLYYQLHSQQMARQYFDAALASSNLDEATRSKIGAIGSAVDNGVSGNKIFGSLQAGARYQSNAAFNSDNSVLHVFNQDYVFTDSNHRGPDGNVFGLARIGYDYDLGNQRGDTVEARFTGYVTQQFRFRDLNVGLYDVSVGPRFALADALPGWSIKPYVTGGQVYLGGARYLTSAGVGVSADIPVSDAYGFEPGVEVARVAFSSASMFSALNTGDTATVLLSGHANFNDIFSAAARLRYTRESADAIYQSSSNFAEELALTARFAAPLPWIRTSWAISPYVKFLQLRLDGPNLFIDENTTRRDHEFQSGIVLDTPINASFSVITTVQNTHVTSNIATYRLHNFSVLTGPALRF